MTTIDQFTGNWVIKKSEGKYVNNSDTFTITEVDSTTATIQLTAEISHEAKLVDDVLKYSFETPCEESPTGICRYDVQISFYTSDVGTYSCLYGVTILKDPEDVAVWGAEEEGTSVSDYRAESRGDSNRLGR